jgi:hypothetical protein
MVCFYQYSCSRLSKFTQFCSTYTYLLDQCAIDFPTQQQSNRLGYALSQSIFAIWSIHDIRDLSITDRMILAAKVLNHEFATALIYIGLAILSTSGIFMLSPLPMTQ